VGVLRYGPPEFETVAVIDSAQDGGDAGALLNLGRSVPIVASLEQALAFQPDSLLVGVVSAGGGLPEGWKPTLLRALEAGLHLMSGLHDFLGDDPDLARAARERGLEIRDLRRPPARLPTAKGKALQAKSLIVLTVGPDCSIGKMTASLELLKSLREMGVSAEFIPTGQTGAAIAGWGIAIDAVVADFVAGAVEQMVMSRDGHADVLIVEGQGALRHPAFSGVTLSLLHGSMPHLLLGCGAAGLRELKRGYGVPIPPASEWLGDYLHFLQPFRPSAKVVGMALDCRGLSEFQMLEACATCSSDTGNLPCVDPVRQGARALAEAIAKKL
jgi:uncharacterized NAD-dependent epimerase/dehydratase family protein